MPVFRSVVGAVVYRPNKAKYIVRPVRGAISRAKPKDRRHGRPTARQTHEPSVALEFTNVSTFANIIRPFGEPLSRDDEDDYEKQA